jgi:hypothetical protein
MAIGDDFEIQNDKDIRYIGAAHAASGAGYYTVLELHRWLQDRADDAAAAGDDFMDITRDTPSDKSFDTIINLINSFNLDDTAAEHVYGGSIIQGNGDVIYDGVQIVANAGVHTEIVQNGALIANDFWNSVPFGSSNKGLNPDSANGIAARFMVKVRTGGADIDGRRLVVQTREWGKTYSEFKVNGTSRGINVVPLTYADDLNNTTAEATVATWTTITNTEGYRSIDVDNNATPENYYSEWNRATFSINQFYERMKWLSRRGSASTLYGINGELFRGITHQVTVDTPTGTFSALEAISWSSGTGRMVAINSPTAPTALWMQLLTGVAPTDNQVITGGTSGATCQVNVTVTERTLSFPFCGVSTGSAIIGAYGFGIEALDLSASDKVFDLTNTQRQAPNYVSFTVGGIVSGEDTVLIGPLGYRFEYDAEVGGPFQAGETLTFTSPAGTAVLAQIRDLGTTGELVIGAMLTGSVPTDNSGITGGTSGATASVNGAVTPSINLRQFTLNGALTGAAVTSVVVNGAIPTDTPATGTIRILRANGAYTRHPYSAWSGSTFTITSHDFSSNNAANGANTYISYIDKLAAATSESFTSVYAGSDRSLFIRVRDGGGTPIKTFETSGTLGSAGGSATAVRTSDA